MEQHSSRPNGPVILIMRQYAYYGRQRTIHSSGQIEAYKNYVNDRSMKVTGGRQCIRTNDGYVIPIDIINGLPYIKMRPNTAKEYKELPHVILTGGTPWNPTVLDNVISDKEDWYNNIKDLHDGLIKTPFDEYGNYHIESLRRPSRMRRMMTTMSRTQGHTHPRYCTKSGLYFE
jgi:hypothetical protein